MQILSTVLARVLINLYWNVLMAMASSRPTYYYSCFAIGGFLTICGRVAKQLPPS